MQIKIGQIYKVKPEFEDVCEVFLHSPDAKYVRAISFEDFHILNEKKQVIGFIHHPDLDHFEPFEKTLYNLEIGDEVEDYVGRRKIIGLIESSSENPVYIVSDYSDYKIARGLFTAKGMSRNNYKVVQPEPTEEIKVEVTKQYMPEIKKLKQITEKCFSDILKILDEYKKNN